jgi:cellulose synthase/poly-beta-1,6-N-acetylglucosamine synthase-like glycosyltransferase
MSGRPSLTFIVPAYNEEAGLPATLEALLAQTEPADEIIVVDDCSSDRTREIAESYSVTVITTQVTDPETGRRKVDPDTGLPRGTGSKAGAQNYALPYCHTDLVLPVDADTVLAPDYAQLIREPFLRFSDVALAAGAVLSRFTSTVWEKGRQIEYLFGFHWFRPVQAYYNSPVVCSGCCSAFRLDLLREFGGFPERTIVEDIDYSWSQQINGHRAVYVGDAVAYAAEPVNAKYMRKQLHRWKSGYFQNVRQHGRNLVRRKPMLALWVGLSLIDTVISPATLALPAAWLAEGRSPLAVFAWWLGSELAILAPALAWAVKKRGMSPLTVLRCYPSFYVLKAFNAWYDWRAIVTELLLVPLGLAEGLHTYEKGRADTAPAPAALAGRHRAHPVWDTTIPLRVLTLPDPDTVPSPALGVSA